MVLPERLSDIADDLLYCATPSVLRTAFSSQLVEGARACQAPTGAEASDRDSCVSRVAEVCPAVVAFLEDFWRYLLPTAEVM